MSMIRALQTLSLQVEKTFKTLEPMGKHMTLSKTKP